MCLRVSRLGHQGGLREVVTVSRDPKDEKGPASGVLVTDQQPALWGRGETLRLKCLLIPLV